MKSHLSPLYVYDKIRVPTTTTRSLVGSTAVQLVHKLVEGTRNNQVFKMIISDNVCLLGLREMYRLMTINVDNMNNKPLHACVVKTALLILPRLSSACTSLHLLRSLCL